MNSLSWMILCAGWASSIGIGAGIVMVGTGGAAIILSIIVAVTQADGDDITVTAGWLKKMAKIFALSLAVAVLVPGKDTFYAIAASELGEDALRSETAGKALTALNAWLDRQIAEEPAASK